MVLQPYNREQLKLIPRELGLAHIENGRIIIVPDPFAEPLPPAKPSAAWTDAELMALPKDDGKRELLSGEIIVSPAGAHHGDVVLRLAGAIGIFARTRGLGVAFDGQTGFRMLDTADVFSPDVSFVSKERLRAAGGVPKNFFRGAPDLAVEVLSPGDSLKLIEEKLRQYFANGTRLAWVVSPTQQTVHVHRGLTPDRMLKAGDQIEGEEVLPGFAYPVADLFAVIDFD
ncbi:MAG TPA: Uma2 family endonuclease [Tepidisphaeraceae bacterium]|nr:Uma2 family endonuclease [Tepidisphaeraceae bacterium]